MITQEEAEKFAQKVRDDYLAKETSSIEADNRTYTKYIALLDQIDSNLTPLNTALRNSFWELYLQRGKVQTKLYLSLRKDMIWSGKPGPDATIIGTISYNSDPDVQSVYFTNKRGVTQVIEVAAEKGSPTSVESILLEGLALAFSKA